MRYWRHYPKFLQVILLMLMIFTLFSFSTAVISFSIPPLFGVRIQDVIELKASSAPSVINATLFAQAIAGIFKFLLAALLFAHLTHPQALDYLGLRLPQKKIQWILTVLLILCFVPLFYQFGTWMQQIDFGSKAKAELLSNQEKMSLLISGKNVASLLLYLLVFAVVPAMGEELLFRGVIMRFSYNSSNNIHFAILFSAALFAMAHQSVHNFLPIMLAGVLLGYLYYFSGSIWLSILAHFINNAFAIVVLVWQNKLVNPNELTKADNFPWYVLLLSAALFIVLFTILRKKATPLPTDWTDDFKAEKQIN